MITIQVPLPNNEYNINIDEGLLQDISKFIDVKKKYVIITDNGVPLKWVNLVNEQLSNSHVYTVEMGEASKSMSIATEILEWLVDNKITRSATIIALGGGVVGDLAGTVASLYMRGVPFIQIPTTLLSQIDSSVGGKVAVNSKSMKNAFGAFYQPKLVLIDPLTLTTLSDEHIANGMSEMIKYGMIQDRNLIEELEEYSLNEKLTNWISRCVEIKKEIVLKDEKDLGLRQVLNYGHTLGHAIEKDSKHGVLHGQAVAIGMKYMTYQYDFYERFIKLLKKYDLDINYDFNVDEIIEYIKTDKKASDDIINIILVEEIGNVVTKKVNIEELRKFFEVKL